MSGSFYTLNAKYNTLLQLIQKLQGGGGGGGNLQQTLTSGNVADLPIILETNDLVTMKRLTSSSENIILARKGVLDPKFTADWTLDTGGFLIDTGVKTFRYRDNIYIDGVGGQVGQVLSADADGLLWVNQPNLQSGKTGVLSSTTGDVFFASSYTETNTPNVTLTLNTNGDYTFIPIAVISFSGTAGNWTGFTWGSAYISATATITWTAQPSI